MTLSTRMAWMEIWAATLPATSMNARAAGESGASATVGRPSPPPERTRGSIGTSPRDGLPISLAMAGGDQQALAVVLNAVGFGGDHLLVFPHRGGLECPRRRREVRAVEVRVHEPHPAPDRAHAHRQVPRRGLLPHPSLARAHGHDV